MCWCDSWGLLLTVEILGREKIWDLTWVQQKDERWTSVLDSLPSSLPCLIDLAQLCCCLAATSGHPGDTLLGRKGFLTFWLDQASEGDVSKRQRPDQNTAKKDEALYKRVKEVILYNEYLESQCDYLSLNVSTTKIRGPKHVERDPEIQNSAARLKSWASLCSINFSPVRSKSMVSMD